jgi:hypothetical protein
MKGMPEGKGGGEEGEPHQETHRVPGHSLVVPAHSDSCSFRRYRYMYIGYQKRKHSSQRFGSGFHLGQRIQISNSDPDPGRPKFKLSPKRENIYDGF